MVEYEIIDYYEGLFDKYKNNPDLWGWADDFPQVMLGLGFDLNGEEPYIIAKKLGLKLKEPSNKREDRRNVLYILEHASRKQVGNYLFSIWRFYTHWNLAGYNKYDADFVIRILKILEDKYKK